MDLQKELAMMKKSLQKIVSLQEIYQELSNEKGKNTGLEAEYARDQILRLSLFLKHKIKELEVKEKI